jgi:hypothetical protein
LFDRVENRSAAEQDFQGRVVRRLSERPCRDHQWHLARPCVGILSRAADRRDRGARRHRHRRVAHEFSSCHAPIKRRMPRGAKETVTGASAPVRFCGAEGLACMRRKVTVATLQRFMQELARESKSPGKVYFTGGATALLLGFRDQTIDIDLKLDPEPGGAFEAIAALKDRLELNVELASPDDFIPRTDDWRERSRRIAEIGPVEYLHYDFTLQALAKIERGHAQDLEDVASLVRGGYVNAQELRACFARIEPQLLRYPALDPEQFRRKLKNFLAGFES